ncbi:uncharacterized protein L969DRAFT_85286 [Mixia osmundae IAM 14324]|uniref:Mitochondrial carrier n=1 Tax=Mixia osmundae (strain CBS 9802 / IAM 14324 / JCM 22182 / KY 12970) TaxID=764103 RepID=G7DYD9_MIXOS|nr:uncharacterized protein L969DRAFT_85286 [Mixia osmundae IAM 14324]KEI41501.1 hypothetical protein L969DRAFT_85286 [Mixia osmundae IAM 14324]GAA95599.1 hypothetical protein E5Q_02255 [Mixia osmundae IAM 14324]
MADEIEYEGLGNASLGINMLAGALAGISEHAVMFPVDVVKTRMQVYSTSPAAVYTGVAEAFSRISATEGGRRLWRGVASVIAGAGPAHAVYFGVYELAKELGGGNAEGNHFAVTAGAGALATIGSDALMNPFDVVKQRMQIHGSTYRTVPDTFRRIYRAEGISAFYASLPTTLLMTIPFTATQFTVYEYLKKLMNPNNSYSPITHITAGGIAGGVAAAVTTPLDVCKTMLQTRGSSQDAVLRNVNGMLQAGRIVLARDGVAGFSRGMTPRVMSALPSNALCWFSYEAFKMLLHKNNKAASAGSVL